MPIVQDERKLQQAIGAALLTLSERARASLPDTGGFAPILARFSCDSLLQNMGEAELKIAPVGGDANAKERFLEAKVATRSAGSHSAEWVFYGSSAALKALLQNLPHLQAKVRATLVAGAESLLRNELP
ncbi:hypothetical protein JGU66_00260 [Myxococcaceae bacterium JPH2]|nr:hypothetical protein [Myxococcaceae bacterium JPH2]